MVVYLRLSDNEKETDKAVSNSDINAECAYTSRLVEMRGVEPLSESTFTVTSPGAVCLFAFPP